MRLFVLNHDNAFERTLRIFPSLTFFTFLINTFFIFYKGTPQLDLDDLPLWVSIVSAISVATLTSLGAWFLFVPYKKNKILNITNGENNIGKVEAPTESDCDTIESNIRTKSYKKALSKNDNSDEELKEFVELENKISIDEEKLYDNDLSLDDNIKKLKDYRNELIIKKKGEKINKLYINAEDIDENVEKLCSSLQVITACFSSFAHGANDVANSIAPFATIYAIHVSESVSKKTDVPIWILFIGGVGIVLGLATWGYKIIDRIGRELTKITASRGFIIELSAALTTLIASRLEIPVSTTHCQIGSVVGCGWGDGRKNIEWSLIKNIVFSWIVTLPFTGVISALLFSFAHYSP